MHSFPPVARIVSGILAALLLASPPLAGAQTADEVRRESGLDGGLAVHVGVTDGKLEADLAGDGRWLVQGLTTDAAAADRARAAVREVRVAGVAGLASVARVRDFSRLPYADHLVNVLVVDADALGDVGLGEEEMRRVLVPERGVALVRRGGSWQKITKPMPEAFDTWPQYSHGPGWNAVSDETQAGPGRLLQWLAGRGTSLGKSRSSGFRMEGGRVFHHADDHNELIGRDAFNGVPLWRKEAQGGARETPMIATADRLYTVLDRGGAMVELSAATGEVLATLNPEAKQQQSKANEMPMWATLAGEVLVQTDEGRVYGLDAASGKVLWTFTSEAGQVVAFPVVATDLDQVMFAVGDKGVSLSRWPFTQGRAVVALDLRTGKERWRNEAVAGLGLGELCYQAGVLGFFEPKGIGTFNRGKGKSHFAGAIDAKTGETLWKHEYGDKFMGQVLLFRGENLYVAEAAGFQGFNAKTGEETDTWKNDSNPNCNRARATQKYWSFSAVTFLEADSGRWTRQWITRSVCAAGGWPAYGMMYFVPNGCVCFAQVRGYLALSPREMGQPVEDGLRLESAGDATPGGGAKATAADWPTWGGNGGRTFANAAELPDVLEPLWTATPGEPLAKAAAGSPVVADWTANEEGLEPLSQATVLGEVACVADPHRGRVTALSVADGEVLWTFDVGARVDTPPTLHEGRAIFGARDGYVYAVDLKTGRELWRFLAAPLDERMIAQGQVESQWPVVGSVLMHEGSVWACAGRHPEIDGGLVVWQLDPATGKPLWKHQEDKPGESLVWFEREQAMDRDIRGNANMRRRHNVQQAMLATGRGGLISLSGLAIDPQTRSVGRIEIALPYAFPDDRDNNNSRRYIARTTVGEGTLVRTFPSQFAHGPEGYWDKPAIDLASDVQADLIAVDADADDAYSVRGERYKVRTQGLARWAADGIEPVWQAPMPERVTPVALLKAGDRLLLCGWNYRDKQATLATYDAQTGRPLGSVRFDAQPVANGVCVAGGRVLVACRDGSVRAFGE